MRYSINDLTDTDIPDINLGGTLYSLGELLDKTLIASTPVTTYFSPISAQVKLAYKYNQGETVGQVFSWVGGYDTQGNADGSIWLMFYPANGDADTALQNNDPKSFYYWKVKDGTGISTKALTAQGVPTVAQQTADKAAKEADTMDKISLLFKTYAPYALAVGGLILAAKIIPPFLPKKQN